jgi:hypothetical protein
MAIRVAAAAAGLLALAGCGSSPPPDVLAGTVAPCPFVGIIADGADLTRYQGGGSDLARMVFDARISGFDLRCEWVGRREALLVTITPRFTAERGPAAGAARNVDLPWTLGVSNLDQSEILARQDFLVRGAFAANSPRLAMSAPPVPIRLPGRDGAETRQILIGFSLTPEELARNRRRGPR